LVAEELVLEDLPLLDLVPLVVVAAVLPEADSDAVEDADSSVEDADLSVSVVAALVIVERGFDVLVAEDEDSSVAIVLSALSEWLPVYAYMIPLPAAAKVC